MIDVYETIGSRAFSAHLSKDGMVVVKEHERELDRVTLNTAYAALVEDVPAEEDLREATVEAMMHALLHEYARVL